MQVVNKLLEIIRHEIHKSGVLPFARFMELALYCPVCGYYETKKDIGRRGDFYTSASTGELFGQLLACQFADWLEELKLQPASPATRHPPLCLIEAGAHDGKLASDILDWLQIHRPKLFSEIEYWILEPSLNRLAWQQATLNKFAPRARWFTDLKTLSPATRHSPLRGVIFSNELLDAFPVHRFGWDAKNKTWFEWGVAIAGDEFVWAKIQNPVLPPSILHLPSSLLAVLPDGYTIETAPAAETWWRDASDTLEHGWLVTLDYGLTADELFSPARPHGTLRAYSRHHINNDLLAGPGEQDITAHVNFSAIQRAGEDCGLKTEFFGSQAKFLTEILAAADKDRSLGESLGEWSATKARQFQTLTHPEYLGNVFRVLVQSR